MQLGFEQGKASQYMFYRSLKAIRAFVHGEGYVPSGHEEYPKWFATKLKEQCECKVQILGPDKADETQLTILNRILT